MKNKEIPYCFQRQIYKRMSIGIAFIIICLIMFSNIYSEKLFMSAFLIGLIILLDILYFYIRAVKGEFVRLQGTCVRTETKGIGKRLKYIYMEMEQGIMRIPVKENIRDIHPGDIITVYMGLATLVYQQENLYIINDYYVMDHCKKSVAQ